MKTEENKKKVELNDEQLNDIAGGFTNQNHSKNQQRIPQQTGYVYSCNHVNAEFSNSKN